MRLFHHLTCYFFIISIVLKFYYDLFTAFTDTSQKVIFMQFFNVSLNIYA